MANNGNCFETQLIYGNGTFNDAGIEKFVKKVDLVNCGLSYAVVSIIGPQSSGKSTLLNHLFGTKFKEMNGDWGRAQTTQGIWIAKSKGIDPLTLVLDVEGTDGKERGQGDTTFEKQSSLFALTISDVVLINVWNNDIGRENAANRPLLRTLFQASKKLSDPRKTKLLFVIRDLSKTPLVRLDEMLQEDIEKIWEDVITDGTPLNDYFIVDVVALPHYEHKLEDFKKEVELLRQRFFHSISPGGLAGDRNVKGVVPASGFSFKSQQIWKVIKENKDLDLPSIQAMVAIVRCQEIALKKYDTAKKEWPQMEEGVKCGTVRGFVNQLKSLVDICLSEYDAESMGYDEGARSTHLNQLQQNLLQLFDRAFRSALKDIRSRALNEFKDSLDKALNGGQVFSEAADSCKRSCMSHFDEECPDVEIEQAKKDRNEVREKLQLKIDVYIIRAAKIFELTSSYQEILKEALAEPVESILDEAKSDAWPSIRILLQDVTKSAISTFLVELSEFHVDSNTRKEKIESLEAFARNMIEEKVRNEASNVLLRMKERFTMLFSYGSDSMPRVWKKKEDINGLAMTAYSASLELLSVMAAIRLDNDDDNIEETLKYVLLGSSDGRGSKEFDPLPPRTRKQSAKMLELICDKAAAIRLGNDDIDNIEETLKDELVELVGSSSGTASKEFDLLASSTWKQVPSYLTVITPRECKKLWGHFIIETIQIFTEAINQQRIVKLEARHKKIARSLTALVVAVSLISVPFTGVPLVLLL